MTLNEKVEMLTESTYKRIVKIVANCDGEFDDVYAKVGAIQGRIEVFMDEIDELREQE